MFYPGETVELRFLLPFSVAEVEKVLVSLGRRDEGGGFDYIVLDKSADVEEVSRGESVAYFTLTENESLMFEDDRDICIQLNIRTTNNELGVKARHTSDVMLLTSGTQYYREVVTDG